jgi:hypothetical protein
MAHVVEVKSSKDQLAASEQKINQMKEVHAVELKALTERHAREIAMLEVKHLQEINELQGQLLKWFMKRFEVLELIHPLYHFQPGTQPSPKPPTPRGPVPPTGGMVSLPQLPGGTILNLPQLPRAEQVGSINNLPNLPPLPQFNQAGPNVLGRVPSPGVTDRR